MFRVQTEFWKPRKTSWKNSISTWTNDSVKF